MNPAIIVLIVVVVGVLTFPMWGMFIPWDSKEDDWDREIR